jgi:hypothetical protein
LISFFIGTISQQLLFHLQQFFTVTQLTVS